MNDTKQITKPGLITHKKLIGNIYNHLIQETIEHIVNDLELPDQVVEKLNKYIYKNDNLEKVMKINTPKNIRNKLVKHKNT